MKREGRRLGRWFVIGVALVSVPAAAASVRVAVASNFAAAASEIASLFEAESGHQVTLAFASTGKHYAQIINGAPFDALLAADARRPRLLEEDGAAIADSRFTYARGRLVLWSPRPGLVDANGSVLTEGRFRRLAIANPKLAPYGAAARDVLGALGVWEALERKIVRGENIAQALQFVDSGNAELGFIAAAQLSAARRSAGSWWDVPVELYEPIEQQAVLLRESGAARDFLSFLRSQQALTVVIEHGYGKP